MKHIFLICLALALPAAAEDMKPNKDPVPSPSDIRAINGQDKPHRSLEMNRAEALARLNSLVAAAAHVPKKRHATRPTRSSQRRRVDTKKQRGRIKALRRRLADGE